MTKLSGLLGMAAILGIAFLFSTNRKAIRVKTIAWGLGLQFAFAVLVLRTTAGQAVFRWIGDKVTRLLAFAFQGSSFVFGQLGTPATRLQSLHSRSFRQLSSLPRCSPSSTTWA